MTSHHHRFFSSLKHVENRLASEQEEDQKRRKKQKQRGIAENPTQARGLLRAGEGSAPEETKNRSTGDNPSRASRDLAYERLRSPLFLAEALEPDKRTNGGTGDNLSQISQHLSSEELSSPLFFANHRPETAASGSSAGTGVGESEPPWEFLSHSPSSGTGKHAPDCGPLPPRSSSDRGCGGDVDRGDDDIERLMGLLGLSADEDGGEGGGGEGECCCSGSGFYSRVVGVKGPKCEKEKGRLDGWIRHYRAGRTEPARLAYLLLAKAVSLSAVEDDDDVGGKDGDLGFEDMDFPLVVEDYLGHDPPPPRSLQ